LSLDEHETRHKAYRAARRRWARKIGLPYTEDLEKPDPGELELETDEEG
jgi:hypothetical protein